MGLRFPAEQKHRDDVTSSRTFFFLFSYSISYLSSVSSLSIFSFSRSFASHFSSTSWDSFFIVSLPFHPLFFFLSFSHLWRIPAEKRPTTDSVHAIGDSNSWVTKCPDPYNCAQGVYLGHCKGGGLLWMADPLAQKSHRTLKYSEPHILFVDFFSQRTPAAKSQGRAKYVPTQIFLTTQGSTAQFTSFCIATHSIRS